MRRRSTGTRRLATLIASALGAGLLAVAVPASPATAADAPPRPIVTGWGYFGSAASASTRSAVANADLLGEVSPFWYVAQDAVSPTVAEAKPCSACSPYAANKAEVLADLRAAGVKVLPTITDGMTTGTSMQLAKVLDDPTRRAALVSSIVSLVQANDYDGIDLDFEDFAFSDPLSTWDTTRPDWVTFIGQLSASLHARGKLLSVTTPPIYTNNRTQTSSTKWNDGYWVYDWAGIADKVDRLRIMAYDYSVSGGPIAPLPWVERVVQHAVSVVPSGKVQIGVPAYGRNATVKVNGVSKVSGTCPTNKPANYLSTLSFTAAAAGTAIPTNDYSSATVNRSAAVRDMERDQRRVAVHLPGPLQGHHLRRCRHRACVVYRTGWYDNAASALARARARREVPTARDRAVGPRRRGLGAVVVAARATRGPSRRRRRRSRCTCRRTTTYGTTATVAAPATSDGVAVQGPGVLYARKAGTSSWSLVTSATTDAAGRVSLPHKVTTSHAVQGPTSRAPGTATRGRRRTPRAAHRHRLSTSARSGCSPGRP